MSHLKLMTTSKCVLMSWWIELYTLVWAQNLEENSSQWQLDMSWGRSVEDITIHLIDFSDFWGRDEYDHLQVNLSCDSDTCRRKEIGTWYTQLHWRHQCVHPPLGQRAEGLWARNACVSYTSRYSSFIFSGYYMLRLIIPGIPALEKKYIACILCT